VFQTGINIFWVLLIKRLEFWAGRYHNEKRGEGGGVVKRQRRIKHNKKKKNMAAKGMKERS